MEKFPELNSPFTASGVAHQTDNSSPLSDLLIPLFSGPGRDVDRLNFAKAYLKSGQENGSHHCALDKDIRNNTSAFYMSAQQKHKMLRFLLEHEKSW